MDNALAPFNLIAAVEAVTATGVASSPWYVWISYLVAAALFVLSLKWLSHPRTARRGVRAGEIGMAIAIIGTIMMYFGVSTTLKYAFIGMVLGSLDRGSDGDLDADDGRAAADRAVARLRRIGGGARRHCPLLRLLRQ